MPMSAANPSPLGTLSNFDTGDGHPRTDRKIYSPMETCPGTYQSASWGHGDRDINTREWYVQWWQ